MKLAKKVVGVEAFQVNNDDGHRPAWFYDLWVNGKIDGKSKGIYSVKVYGGIAVAVPGDWIIRDEYRGVSVCEDSEFCGQYAMQ